ncbi:MAG: metal ABC transporter ATP-binding protein [Nitriliruptoraceae bacterium]
MWQHRYGIRDATVTDVELENIMGIIPRFATQEPAGPRSDVAVDVHNLTVRFDDVTAVAGATVALPTGSLTAIIGPNGSGKSTLLSAIAGLVAPSRGSVRVHGQPPAATHARIAYVMQSTVDNAAVPLTVRETVRMGCYARTGMFGRLRADDRAAVDDAISRMDIADISERQLRELSGGQRQRAYVAQGLAQRADVLLLDEPITGLDFVTQQIITDVIAAERERGHTVVVTTHDVGTARAADLVLLMATEVVAFGASADTLTPDLLMRAYGGHIHVLDDGTVVLDDPHHHGVPEQLN